MIADGHLCGTSWARTFKALANLLQDLSRWEFGGKAGRRLSRAWGCCLSICSIDMCMQDMRGGLGLGQQVGVVTGVHTFMHLPTGACAHMRSQVHRPCRACRGTCFSCFQLPLLDKSVFFLSPKCHTFMECLLYAKPERLARAVRGAAGLEGTGAKEASHIVFLSCSPLCTDPKSQVPLPPPPL